jgi:hypothetical protein
VEFAFPTEFSYQGFLRQRNRCWPEERGRSFKLYSIVISEIKVGQGSLRAHRVSDFMDV